MICFGKAKVNHIHIIAAIKGYLDPLIISNVSEDSFVALSLMLSWQSLFFMQKIIKREE